MNNERIDKQSSKLTDFTKSCWAPVHSSAVAAGELKMCAFIAEHNLPIATLDHLSGLIVNICPDSKIAKDLKCARTKGTDIFTNVIGAVYFEELVCKLKNVTFSLIILGNKFFFLSGALNTSTNS